MYVCYICSLTLLKLLHLVVDTDMQLLALPTLTNIVRVGSRIEQDFLFNIIYFSSESRV